MSEFLIHQNDLTHKIRSFLLFFTNERKLHGFGGYVNDDRFSLSLAHVFLQATKFPAVSLWRKQICSRVPQ